MTLGVVRMEWTRRSVASPSRRIKVLFTGETGEQFGYQDGPIGDGVFRFTGQGQTGDMEFVSS